MPTPRPLFALTAPAPLPLAERDVARQIKDFLLYRGWHIQRCHVGKMVPWRIALEAVQTVLAGRYADAVALLNRSTIALAEEGTADLLAVHPTLPPLFIETKRPKGKLRASQVAWLGYMRDRRGFHASHFDSIESFSAYYRSRVEALQ